MIQTCPDQQCSPLSAICSEASAQKKTESDRGVKKSLLGAMKLVAYKKKKILNNLKIFVAVKIIIIITATF